VEDQQDEIILKTLHWSVVIKRKDTEFDTDETTAGRKHGLGWTTVGPHSDGHFNWMPNGGGADLTSSLFVHFFHHRPHMYTHAL
jgi:hypothetical protein